MSRKKQDTKHPQGNRFNQDDVYGVLGKKMEVDSDVNEDPNRERLLDEAFNDFVGPSDRNN
ncbi:hypothetical protein [Ammoniphilus resinae]|uniref:Uncharacterized protein n=1 Tax=Ammoniphilus resinae TaxID=861532 RepID=A0ABS4GJW7_9BACL|nr:hypothetical protein [Ammoniphilus resinae]MBP1930553.1 hypothetical protein [Ammoniphilus resinae]